MWKNYLKVAWRSVTRHLGYSFINIVGLAVGMACALFILLWIGNELSVDRFHANAATLYRVEQDQQTGQGTFHVAATPYPLGPAVKTEVPEVRDTVRVARPGDLLVRWGENAFFETRVLAVDPQFLRMFSFPLLRGDPASALSRPGSLVVTEEMARKYFGSADPLGKAVTVNNRHAFTVTGVLRDVPRNSSLRFAMLVPFDFVRTLGQYNDSMGQNDILTFVQLHPRGDRAAAEAKITRLVRDRIVGEIRADPELMKEIQNDPVMKGRPENYRGPSFTLMPLGDIYLYGYFGFSRSNMGIQTLYIFGVIALFVLLIACINFMNLATARSASRAKEVGLRKVVGAQRQSIIGQFYGESILTTLLAGLLAFALVILLLPAFNSLSGKLMTAADLLTGRFLAGSLAVVLLTGLLAGSYPALLLSAFQPLTVLRSARHGGGRSARFRQALVILQFSISIFLLIGLGVVSRQVHFMRNKQLGYDKEQLIYLPLRGDTPSTYGVLKERLLSNPRVLGVTATHQQPTSISSNGGNASWDGKDPARNYLIGYASVDFDYPETLRIGMAAGRSFSKKYSSDAGRAWMVNEEVVRLMGLDPAAAVGKRFNWGVEGPIVGVMKNFHYQSVRSAIEPLAVLVNPQEFLFAVVRLKAGEIPAALADVQRAWRQVNPLYPVEYRFFDEDFGEMYQNDERLGSLLNVFAAMAMIIACLGLFGLAAFMAEQRTREIGVRKVLGATSAGIVRLLSQEFLRWVVAANLIAWPAAYFLMRRWLQDFAYRVPIGPGVFLLSGLLALSVAMLTVSAQSLRAARANPVESLRYE